MLVTVFVLLLSLGILGIGISGYYLGKKTEPIFLLVALSLSAIYIGLISLSVSIDRMWARKILLKQSLPLEAYYNKNSDGTIDIKYRYIKEHESE